MGYVYIPPEFWQVYAPELEQQRYDASEGFTPYVVTVPVRVKTAELVRMFKDLRNPHGTIVVPDGMKVTQLPTPERERPIRLRTRNPLKRKRLKRAIKIAGRKP